ncbi:MAG: hypothetical protein ORN27_03950 [Rhodoluna sp.]|nr:hypothetical protein [Rhodoluna sp.]
MFKKLGTIALSAAIALLGLQAAPANAAASDPVAGSVVGNYVGFSLPLSTTVPVTAGITSINVSKYWVPTASDIATLGGKTVGFQVTVTQPNGTPVAVSTSMGASSGLSATNSNPQISFSTGGMGMPLQNMYPATTLTMPSDVSAYTSGYLSTYINVQNRSGYTLTPLPTGNWTISVLVTVNNTPVTESTTHGASWAVDTMSSLNESASGSTGVVPTGATGVSASARICVDSALVTAGDVLTGGVSFNGTASSSPSSSFAWKVSNGSSRPNGMGTVLATDAANGLYASVYSNLNSAPVAGTTYNVAFTMLKGATNVTGSCAPAAPAKPTISFSNGSFQIGYVLPVGADSYSTVCNLYDSTDTANAVATSSGNSSNSTCSLSAGTIVGHSYVAKVSAGWQGYAQSDLSAPSDAVVKPALGYTFTAPVSGITNAGGKLSRVSNSIPADANASLVTSLSDGGSGVVTLETEQGSSFGTTTSAAFVLRHVTKSGADGTFAGTGSVRITPTAGQIAGTGRFGWYGANHANWSLTYGNVDPMAMVTTVNFVTGSFASAATSTVTVDNGVLNTACTTTYGAGLTDTTMSAGPSIPNVSVVPSVSSTPLYLLTCYKAVNNMGITSYLSNPILFSVTNATTINVIKALNTPSVTVNNAQVYYSSNPNAGANDAAVTFVVIQSLNSSGATTVASRSIINMTPGLTFTTAAGTYSVTGIEPQVRLAALNDGTVWGLLVGTSTQLLKIAGDTVTTTTVTPDTVAGFTNSSFSLPIGLQAGSAAGVEVIRSSTPTGSIAMASVNPSTGAVTTAEVATYTVATGGSVLSSYFFSSNNVYWLVSDIASPTTYSLYKWLDLNFHLTAQTVAWANNSPTTIIAGGTATVSATATSALAVSYGTTDGSICTVNASTGVVTAVASTGNCVVTADQAGNGTFDSSPQVTLTLAITARPLTAQTITWTTSPTSVTVGSTATVAATASSNLAVTYSSTDTTKCTVTSAGVVTPVATTGTCTIAADQAGNGTYSAAPQKTLAITIGSVAPAKSAPKTPTVATKAKVGKTFTVALSATKGTAAKGANVDGLPTVVSVAPATKAFCSVAKVIKSKKITGYTVKGLKAGKCSVVVTITGNATYNALTKTVAVTVTK